MVETPYIMKHNRKSIPEHRATRRQKESRVTTSGDVPMCDPSSSNMTTRGSAKRHDDEHGREEVAWSMTSSDASNVTRGTVKTRCDVEIEEEIKKPKSGAQC